MKEQKQPSKPVLVLRTCNADMSSHHTKNFVWPKSGFCEAPDWNPDPNVECGQGLHGLLWGQGDWSLLGSAASAVWMVVRVNPDEGMVAGKSKCRFKRGEVLFCGDRGEATTRMMCSPEALENAQETAKEWSKKNKPKRDQSISSGNFSRAASSGDNSRAASSGNASSATSSGNASSAASEGGSNAAVAVGADAVAKAGEHGLIVIVWWDEAAKRYRVSSGEVGNNGIKPNMWYKVRNGTLVEA